MAVKAFVTGAASGIGRATALALAQPGATLVLATRANRASLEQVAADCRGKGATVHLLLGDLGEAATARALAEQAIAAADGLDALVNVAGRALRKPIAEVSSAELQAAVALSADAFLILAQAVLPALKASKQGRIIAVSSFNAHVYPPRVPPFGASAAGRAALEALVKALAAELAPSGITVNAVAPGFTRKDAGSSHSALTTAQWAEITRAIPLGRLGEPAEVAAMIAFLAGPQAGYVTGQVIHVSGGLVL